MVDLIYVKNEYLRKLQLTELDKKNFWFLSSLRLPMFDTASILIGNKYVHDWYKQEILPAKQFARSSLTKSKC
jgi:hypothetical protein